MKTQSQIKQQKKISNNKTKKNTYIIKNTSNYKNTHKLQKTLHKRGNWEEYNETTNKIDLLYFIGKIDEKDKNITKAKVINNINNTKSLITKKDNIYELLSKNDKVKKYLLEQHKIVLKNILNYEDNFLKYRDLFKNNIWTFKIIDNWGNTDLINIFNHYNDFQLFSHHILLHNSNMFKSILFHHKLNKKSSINNESLKVKDLLLDEKYIKNEWILQKYISNPLLIQRKRFNIRVYFIYNESQNNGFLNKYGILQIARNNFKLDNFFDKNIHHTQNNSINSVELYPDYFIKSFGGKNYKKINDGIQILIKEIIQILKDKKKNNNLCFAKKQNCFELFSADLIISREFQIKLLEVNYVKSYPTINTISPNNQKIKKDYVNEIFNQSLTQIIDKIYDPNKNIPNNDVDSQINQINKIDQDFIIL